MMNMRQTGNISENRNKEEKFNSFSVPLGLLDYINPICYCITMVTIIKNTKDMGQPYSLIFLIGAVISIFFGFIIPTGKVIVAPVIMYAFAILLFIMLCGIGIKADLKNPKVHWVIEASNVICQMLVAIATKGMMG